MGPVAALVLCATLPMLTACDQEFLDKLRAPVVARNQDDTAVTTPQTGEPGTSAARPTQAPQTITVAPNRPTEPPLEPVIVRGRQPAEAAPARVAPAPGAPANQAADVTLNFVNADIHDVIASILGETLRLNYVIDADVAGQVTFNVSRPLPRSDVLPALEAVLNSRGATMVQTDGIVRVTTLRNDGKIQAAAPVGRAGLGQRIVVLPVRFVPAGDISRILERVLPPGRLVSTDESRGLIVVQGTPDDVRTAEDTVKVFDIDQLSGASVAILPLANSDAATVITELQSIFDTKKEATGGIIRFMPIERMNAVMVITRQPRYIDEARSWVTRLDRTRNVNEQRLYVYYVQHGKAALVARTLQGALSGLDIQLKPSTMLNIAQDNTFLPLQPYTPGIDNPGLLAPPPSMSAPMPAPLPAPQLVPVQPAAQPSPNGKPMVRVEPDEAHNALLISATPKDYVLIRQVLEGIDIPPLQVLIEVTVAEVVLNNNLRYGVQYFINSRINSSRQTTVLTNSATSTAISPAVPGFSLAISNLDNQPKVILDALSALTQTKVISTPRLLVLDNQIARLQVGDVVPIITQSATSTVTAQPLVLSNVQYKETGVVLEVTPRINTGGFVTLEVNQIVSDVVPTTTSTINSPTIRQRRLTSTISVRNGSAILLGGLIQEQDNRDASGIPILNEIPILGALFGSRTDAAARTELIILLTPHVISNDEEARDVTEQVRRQFQAVLDRVTMPPVRQPPR